MKNVRAIMVFVLPAVAVIVGLCLMGQPAIAQSANSPSAASAQQQPDAPANDQNAAPKEATFTGTIVKAGDKLVLSDTNSKVTYQLDDQQKAEGFLNKNVKVTGVLDSSTGMIRVSAIGPA
jgi:hypothetical protein